VSSAAVQTLWAELIAGSLADAGVRLCVISPGSRSTPLVAAIAREPRLSRVTLVDERAAAFYALGAARATGEPAALVCTSGTAAAHYLPAIIEASSAGVPLLALTADRPPELQACGASQTIDQIGLYGGFVRAALDLGAPVGSPEALRAVRRKVVQAVTLARGPAPGPVHLEVPLRKPLEPAAAESAAEHALARTAAALRGPALIAPPRLIADAGAVAQLAAAIASEPAGLIVAGALPPTSAARAAAYALAARAGYPIVAEASSQLRFGPRPRAAAVVDHFDLIPAAQLPAPRLMIELGGEPVAAAWAPWIARLMSGPRPPARWILAGATWRDPDSGARAVVLGDPADALTALLAQLELRGARSPEWSIAWAALDRAAGVAAGAALAAVPHNEVAVLEAALAALPEAAVIQLGNSLPIRTIDHARAPAASPAWRVIAQRGAAGIDGLVAAASGATRAGAPVLLVVGDVSFAHDLGGLLAARATAAPLAVLVVDNGGGQIFGGMPVARAGLGAAFDEHWITAPAVDPVAIAAALGLRGVRAATPAEVAAAVAAALRAPGAATTVIHAPVAPAGARDVRRAALELGAPGAGGGDP
jgi:2-succinyl-5-enolpyruvyl-6-hydroxy-3-cyclohexene-1-carboxylate synthase